MSDRPLPPVIVLAGPTGVGKTRLSIDLARALGGEIVNYDSIQLYRGFDIGSAKPTVEERSLVPHHLFDVIEPTDEMNAAAYVELARATTEMIRTRQARPVFVGGTGFYMRAFVAGLPELPQRDAPLRARLRKIIGAPGGRERLHRLLLRVDPEAGSRIAPADSNRLERALEVYFLTGQPISRSEAPTGKYDALIDHAVYALTLDRAELIRRLEARVDAMFAGGLIEETAALLSRYPSSARPFTSIGYREAMQFLSGEISLEAAITETKRRTRAYSKRQMTWLRGEPRVRWLDAADPAEALRQIVTEQR